MQSIYQRLVQWGFERLYHELAWSYDLVAAAVSRGYWRHWIAAVLPYLQGGGVLEVGCGTGYLQLALAGTPIPHIGYDASREMLRQAARRLRRAGYEPWLLRGRAQALPFPAASFTDVVATFPAPYILRPATLVEIRRVLQDGGQLLIVDGGQLEDGGLYKAAVDVAVRATLQGEAEDRYGRALLAAGFSVERRRVVVGQSSVEIIIGRHAQDANRRV